MFYKPCNVYSEISVETYGKRTLISYGIPKNVRIISRLSKMSEGILLFTDQPHFKLKFLDQNRKSSSTWICFVARLDRSDKRPITQDDFKALEQGVYILGRKKKPCFAKILTEVPNFPPRKPEIRLPTYVNQVWIELTFSEPYVEVRNFLFVIGFVVYRTVLIKLGKFEILGHLEEGSWKELSKNEVDLIFK